MPRSRYISSLQHYQRASPYDPIDESTEGFARVLQLALLTGSTFSVIFCLASVGGCEFLWFRMPNIEIKEFNNTNHLSILDPTGSTKISYGIFKYQNPINHNECFAYDDQPRVASVLTPAALPLQHMIARWGMSISAGLSCMALIFLLIEIFCCRFACSRLLVNFCFLLAICGMPTGFLLYTQGYCNVFSSTNYSCNLGGGAIQALIAMALLFINLVLSCITPKAKPIIRVIQEREIQTEHDPCCCWKGRSKEEIFQEYPSLLLSALPSDEVEIPRAATTYTFKHYFDDQAGGVTLQSQFNAASQRWLQCEQNFTDALDRFKQECGEAAMSERSPSVDWKHVMQLPLNQISDLELLRQRQVLDILKNNCNQARRVMQKIEEDLEDHIRPADKKLEAAFRGFQKQESTRQLKLEISSNSDEKFVAFQQGSSPTEEEVSKHFQPLPKLREPVIATKTEEEFEQSHLMMNHDILADTSVEEFQFKSAVMTFDETTVDEETPKEGSLSWMAWMGWNKSDDDKYKKKS